MLQQPQQPPPPQPQVMLQQAPQQPPPQAQQGAQQQAASQRVFTGTVTKLHDNFGFVDEDVFFQTTVVKGQAPHVNVQFLFSFLKNFISVSSFSTNLTFRLGKTRENVTGSLRIGKMNLQEISSFNRQL